MDKGALTGCPLSFEGGGKYSRRENFLSEKGGALPLLVRQGSKPLPTPGKRLDFDSVAFRLRKIGVGRLPRWLSGVELSFLTFSDPKPSG